MEEPKAAHNPPTVTQTAPPPPQKEPPQPPPATLKEQPASNKRLLENSNQFENSKYFKMRLVLKDLRPHFIEVLRTPDFRNCKAADEIKEKMKLLLELYKQMTAETVSTEKCSKAPGSQPPPGETGMKQKPGEQPQVVKPAIQSENKTFQSISVSEKQQPDGEAPGTYIVGGSAFGWNFTTFLANKPVYYGVTKESFRSAQATLGGE